LYSEVAVNWRLDAVAMNKGVKTKTMIVISDRIFVGELIFRRMAESACKSYVLRMVDILIMKVESIFLRHIF